MKRIDLYDKFHKNTTIQTKIIGDNNFTYRLIIKLINKYVIKKDLKVLDIGCGAGTLSLYIGNKRNQVLGIDISRKAIYESKKSAKGLNLTNVEFKVMNFPYKIPTQKYNIVILTEVLEHLQDDILALKKIYTILHNGGLLILSTPSIKAPLFKLGLLNDFDKRVGHLRRYSKDDLIKLLYNTGYVIVEDYKIEGILRNFLFTNDIAGKTIKYIRGPISDIITFIDQILLSIFGESNYIIIAKKVI